MRLIIQSIKNDLMSRNPIHVSLAMQCIANIGGQDMLESVGQDVPKLLISGWAWTERSLFDVLLIVGN